MNYDSSILNNTTIRHLVTRTTGLQSQGDGVLRRFEAAQVIASASYEWHVIIAARSQHRGNEAANELIRITGNANISAMVLDLSSSLSIHHFVEQFSKAELPPLHVIVCNAGTQFVQGTQMTADGIEATFGVNHLGHFMLVRLLLNHLQENGRIVVVSIDTHDLSKKTGMPAPRYASRSILADPVESDRLHNPLYRVKHIGMDLKRQHPPRNRTIRSIHLSFGSGVLKCLT
ncbi:SDR family NAD(P)-dependent oxidoreductase [Paenibacillus sp. NPDC093718]|uniref:SDR family NAD(P)-dependent oxidoreductase n=1 Tax=Paenibacillus sp. NPDC093718 TaxID=3390601 RepID=UPI003D081EA4